MGVIRHMYHVRGVEYDEAIRLAIWKRWRYPVKMVFIYIDGQCLFS